MSTTLLPDSSRMNRCRISRALAIMFVLMASGSLGCTALSDSISYRHHLPTRKTDAASVEILSQYPEKTYVELAKVEARATAVWVSWDTLHYALREEAARVGADAIVNVTPSEQSDDSIVVTGIGWIDLILKPPRHVSAIAIQYL